MECSTPWHQVSTQSKVEAGHAMWLPASKHSAQPQLTMLPPPTFTLATNLYTNNMRWLVITYYDEKSVYIERYTGTIMIYDIDYNVDVDRVPV